MNRGRQAAASPNGCYDLLTTALHLPGLGREKLSFYNDDIDRCLTDVHGQVIQEILA